MSTGQQFKFYLGYIKNVFNNVGQHSAERSVFSARTECPTLFKHYSLIVY